MPERNTQRKAGITDTPIECGKSDALHIEDYIGALSEFIAECDTPMTIAIQGDWGSGKTSVMKMVQDALGGSAVSVWFNTWQFSQFNMGDSLAITFLQSVLETLEEEGGLTSQSGQMQKRVQFFKKLAVLGTTFLGEGVGQQVENILEKDDSIVKIITNLRNEFQNTIDEATKTKGCDRVVVFVDDLDRLQPVRAVELLEVLKIFLDCRGCVFLLAIDTDVVYQGISEKLGGGISEEKKRSFFDKIIQMPFKMPVSHYKMDSYIKKLVENIWTDMEDEGEAVDVRNVTELINMTADENPRSIKRIINAFTLTDKVARKKNVYDDNDEERRKLCQKILLVMQCLQLKYEEIYEYLLSAAHRNQVGKIIETHIVNEKIDETLSGILRPLGKDAAHYTQSANLAKTLWLFKKWSLQLIELRNKNYRDYNLLSSVITLSAATMVDDIRIDVQPVPQFVTRSATAQNTVAQAVQTIPENNEIDMSLIAGLARLGVDNFETGNDASDSVQGDIFENQDDTSYQLDDLFYNQDDIFEVLGSWGTIDNYDNILHSLHNSRSTQEMHRKYISCTRDALKRFGSLFYEKIGDEEFPSASFGYYNEDGQYDLARYKELFHFRHARKPDQDVCIISLGYRDSDANSTPGDIDLDRFCSRLSALPAKELIPIIKNNAGASSLDKLDLLAKKAQISAAGVDSPFAPSESEAINHNEKILHQHLEDAFLKYADALWYEQERIKTAIMERFDGQVDTRNGFDLLLPYDSSFADLLSLFVCIFTLYSRRAAAERYKNERKAFFKALTSDYKTGCAEFVDMINKAIASAKNL